MKLKRLVRGIPLSNIRGSKEVEITGICANSKLVVPGNLFIAKRGRTVDGSRFIPEAVSAGAVAVLTDMFDPSLRGITQLIHPDVAAIEGLIAAQFNQFPSDELLMVGVTGTNGKTTTSYLIKNLLDRARGPCGMIGTIEYVVGSYRYQATHTTPDVSINQKMLKEMLHHGCRSAVMEVTSHALDQGRVDNIHYDVAIFTNLTCEHLDYHQTMEAYCRAKNQLFRSLDSRHKKKLLRNVVGIANADDPYFQKVVEGCRVNVLTYGIDSRADLQAIDIVMTPLGTKYSLLYMGETYPITVPLIGRYNVYNSLACIACGLSQGMSLETIAAAVAAFSPVPGRLEAVPNPLGLKIYVDFAHTPAALENVLKCVRELTKGRIITVFGCGGDRDQLKRPMMARICEQYSDICVVTTDNPRSESPEAIISAITEGFKDPSRCATEHDRRAAIARAITLATPEDIVLIAGKGHETYQIFAHHTIEFDDRKVALDLCKSGVC